MKIVVTHCSPDWDAITSVWLIKRYLPGWEEATVTFVPAGERLKSSKGKDAIEEINGDKVMHVDTGLGPLDHHQTSDDNVCGASLTFDYVRTKNPEFISPSEKWKAKSEAIGRIVKVVTDIDHFKEVFWPDTTADYQEFSLLGVLEGLKLQKPDQDGEYVIFGMQCLDTMLYDFENRIWAEKEIQEQGKVFTTKYGKGLGIASINDSVIKLAQKMGFVLVIRKDPRKGYVRIKSRPSDLTNKTSDIDLTLMSEQLRKMDPEATWYLHVSKKMLLNGTTKNPKMIPSKLSLADIIKVAETI